MKQTEIGLIPEDWEYVNAEKYINFLTGFPFKSENFSTSGIKLLRGSNVKRNTIDWGEDITKFWSDDVVKFKEFLLEDGDIVISMDGSLVGRSFGQISKNDLPAFLVQRVARVRGKGALTNYLKHLYCSDFFTKHCDNNKTASAIPHISPKDIKEYKILIPKSLAEQEAIANALSDADAWIEKLEQLIAKKRLIKQGAMQTLLTPKEDWEVKKLGEVLTFGSGRDYKHLQEGEIPVYGTGGLMTMVSDFLYDGDSVGIGRKGTIDKPVFLTGKFWTVDTLFYTHSFNMVLPKYIFYQFLLIPWREYNEASGVPSLNKNTLEQIEIPFPSLSEQERIATILSDMDAEIEALEQQLSKARHIKQGMMQELLTGRVRLV